MPAIHVSLNVSDLSKAVDFYRGVFGEPKKLKADYAKFVAESPEIHLALQPELKGSRLGGVPVPPGHSRRVGRRRSPLAIGSQVSRNRLGGGEAGGVLLRAPGQVLAGGPGRKSLGDLHGARGHRGLLAEAQAACCAAEAVRTATRGPPRSDSRAVAGSRAVVGGAGQGPSPGLRGWLRIFAERLAGRTPPLAPARRTASSRRLRAPRWSSSGRTCRKATPPTHSFKSRCNDLVMLVAFAPTVEAARDGRGRARSSIRVLLASVLVFVVIPLVAGAASRERAHCPARRHMVRGEVRAGARPPRHRCSARDADADLRLPGGEHHRTLDPCSLDRGSDSRAGLPQFFADLRPDEASSESSTRWLHQARSSEPRTSSSWPWQRPSRSTGRDRERPSPPSSGFSSRFP